MRYHYIPARVVKREMNDNTNVGKMWNNGNSQSTGVKLGPTTLENCLSLPVKCQ